jgi:hypothetical protein
MIVLHWLLLRVDWVNLATALVAVAVGLLIYYVWSPEVFQNHPFTEWAFWLLMGQWFVFVLIFIILLRFPESQGWLLAALDLQSLLTVGFSWIFLQGDDCKWRGTVGTLLVIAVSLWVWNMAWNPGPGPETAGSLSRLTWLAPSEALSAFAMPLLGFAFFVRYRVFAFPLLFVSVAYATCQRPIYAVNLENATRSGGIHPDVAPILLGLAVGKLILAGLAYGLFFAPVDKYVSATPELQPTTRNAIRGALWKSVRWTFGSVITAGLVGALAEIIAKSFVK